MSKKLTEEIVYSPINDHRIKANLINSPIWKTCYKKEEISKDIIVGHGNRMYAYTIKFDGLKPIQVTNIKKVNNVNRTYEKNEQVSKEKT